MKYNMNSREVRMIIYCIAENDAFYTLEGWGMN
jgi:hypothetical protein